MLHDIIKQAKSVLFLSIVKYNLQCQSIKKCSMYWYTRSHIINKRTLLSNVMKYADTIQLLLSIV